MPTWCRCSPPILFWHWPPFNLFPSSCINKYHFVCSTQQSMCHFDKLSCIYCNAHMIYMYTYFVLTSMTSCFVHVQQHTPPWIAGTGHPCSDRTCIFGGRMRPLAPGRSSADAPRRRSVDEPWAQIGGWALGAVWLMRPGRNFTDEPSHICKYSAQWNRWQHCVRAMPDGDDEWLWPSTIIILFYIIHIILL